MTRKHQFSLTGARTGEPVCHEELSPVPAPFSPIPFGTDEPAPGVSPDGRVRNADGKGIGAIVLPAAAREDGTLAFAAEELRLHVRKVTGADLPVVGRPPENCASFVLATPETLPAVADRFAEDLAWLADTGTPGEGFRYGSDGFAVRRAGDDIFLLGNTARGVLNGVYDLLEKNFGILWVWADEETGTFFRPASGIAVTRVDYREKSPFQYRGWNLCGISGCDAPGLHAAARVCSRNKCNSLGVSKRDPYYLALNENIKDLLKSSPLYDPEETEYWETDENGNPLPESQSRQINPWSEKAADALTATLLREIRETGTRMVYIGEADWCEGHNLPHDRESFEYAPGKFVNPGEENYYSTVFHSMIGKIARRIRAEYPDVLVGTWAYQLGVIPPACDIEDNVYIMFAPLSEDMCFSLCGTDITDKGIWSNITNYPRWLREWSAKTNRLMVYNYYMCSHVAAYAERPIWERMQKDLQGYTKLGIIGLNSEGVPDADGREGWFPELEMNGCHRVWDVNALTFWLYAKLSWNPFADLDALIGLFCERVYGPAAETMKAYYALIRGAWDTVSKTYPKVVYHDRPSAEDWFRAFVEEPGIGDPMLALLNRAESEAEGPVRDRIRYIREATEKMLGAVRG